MPAGHGLWRYTTEARLTGSELTWEEGTKVSLDTDVRLTAPPRDSAVAYTFEGSAGQEVTIGSDIPGSVERNAAVARINAPDGSLVSASGSPATWNLPTAGLYTVEVANTST